MSWNNSYFCCSFVVIALFYSWQEWGAVLSRAWRPSPERAMIKRVSSRHSWGSCCNIPPWAAHVGYNCFIRPVAPLLLFITTSQSQSTKIVSSVISWLFSKTRKMLKLADIDIPRFSASSGYLWHFGCGARWPQALIQIMVLSSPSNNIAPQWPSKQQILSYLHLVRWQETR